MLLSAIQPKHTLIGVDLGATGVRAVQLRRDGAAYSVQAIARSERSIGFTTGAEDALERRLAACVRTGGFRGRNVVVGARACDVEYHLIELPGAIVSRPAPERNQAVRWEVASLMSDSIESVEAQYWLVPPPSAPGPNTFAVGMRAEAVRRAYDACANAGASCTALDAQAAALGRIGCALQPPSPRTVWGVLDLGHEQTRLVLCVDETPVLVRNVGPGGGEWTRWIAETLTISEKAAEIHKREHGIARASRGRRGEEPSEVPGQELGAILFAALRSGLHGITEEIKRSFRYVLGCYSGRDMGGLLLVGGGATMKRLPEFLNEHVGTRVMRASDCLEHQDCRLRFASTRGDALESLALAVGLALPE